MSNETTKTKSILLPHELAWLAGSVLDIGAGDDPVMPHAQAFDKQHGDANHVRNHVTAEFDCVWSSHCLEHMLEPFDALTGWWACVKLGGVLVVTVPDEDLYEQGSWPSKNNADHKWTFTLCKRKSWSPKSVNVSDLAAMLERRGGTTVRMELQDNGYDRALKGVDQTRRPNVLAQIMLAVRRDHV